MIAGDSSARSVRWRVPPMSEDEHGAGVPYAVLDVIPGRAVRERHEDGAEPLAGPEQLDRLEVVPGDRSHTVAASHGAIGEASRDPSRPQA